MFDNEYEDLRLLKKRCEDLVKRRESLLDKIAKVEKAYDAAMASPLQRIELEEEIKRLSGNLEEVEAEYEEKKAELHLRTNELKVKLSPADLLRQALYKLDYTEQIDAFQDAVDNSWMVVFLIHGKQGYGQRWLLYQLEELISYEKEPPHKKRSIKKIPFYLSSQSLEKSVDSFWKELGKMIGANKSLSIQKVDQDAIIKRVKECLREKNICLIFHDAHFMDEEDVQELIQKLWKPLIKQVRRDPHRSSNCYLLMVLVDERNCTSDWNIPFAEKIDMEWNEEIPIKLAELTEFSDDVVTNWIIKEGKGWKENLFDQDNPKVQEIMDYSGNGTLRGTPQKVFEGICILCGGRWDETVQGCVVYD